MIKYNLRFIDNTFSENLLTTLGVELFKKVVNIHGIFYQIKIWDTCGQERLRALTTNYYRNADGIMLLFDLTQVNTFNNIPNWIESVQEKVQDQLPLVIVGNKTDLPDHQVTSDMIKNLSKKYDVEVFKTSAKNGDESGKPFFRLAEEIIENCAHPDYRPLLREYQRIASQGHEPCALRAAFAFHDTLVNKGDMRLTDFAEYMK